MRLVPAAHEAHLRPPTARPRRTGARSSSANAGQSARAAAGGPKLASAGGSAKRAPRHVAHQRVGQARPHPGQQLRDPEAGQAVARVLRPAQAGERVLDVRRLEKLQPAVLHERDVAPAELDLQRVAVVRGAEQHRLLAQRHAGLAPLEDALDDVVDLRQLVGDGDQHRPRRRRRAWRRGSCRSARRASAMTALAASRIGCVER